MRSTMNNNQLKHRFLKWQWHLWTKMVLTRDLMSVAIKTFNISFRINLKHFRIRKRRRGNSTSKISIRIQVLFWMKQLWEARKAQGTLKCSGKLTIWIRCWYRRSWSDWSKERIRLLVRGSKLCTPRQRLRCLIVRWLSSLFCLIYGNRNQPSFLIVIRLHIFRKGRKRSKMRKELSMKTYRSIIWAETILI